MREIHRESRSTITQAQGKSSICQITEPTGCLEDLLSLQMQVTKHYEQFQSSNHELLGDGTALRDLYLCHRDVPQVWAIVKAPLLLRTLLS
jgi:hypothetical protein